MKKTLFVFLALTGVAYGLYTWLFALGAQRYALLPLVKVGMHSTEVRKLLGTPDTAYVWHEAPYPRILEYDMGFAAPDALRVFLQHDTVTASTYNQ